MFIILDNETLAVLQFINDNPKTELEQLHSAFKNADVEDCIALLKNLGYIKGLTPRPFYKSNYYTKEVEFVEAFFAPYSITSTGKAYLEKSTEDKEEKGFQHFHIWTNTIIGVVAIIISIIALFCQFHY